MAQQTAVEWLSIELQKVMGIDIFYYSIKKQVEQAKQIEKEQIITAASIGILWGEDENQLQASVKFGEEYYDRTFISTPQDETPSATRNEQ